MTIDTSWGEDGVEYRLSGVVTLEELQGCVFSYSSDPRADTARYKIIDVRSVESAEVTIEQLETLGAFEYGQTLSTPGLRMAFVSDGRFDMLVDAFTVLMKDSSWTVRSFAEPEAAAAWAKGEQATGAVA